MQSPQRRLVCGIAALLFVLPASAELIDDHLRVRTVLSSGAGSFDEQSIEGNNELDTGEQSLVNGFYSSSGRATVERIGQDLRVFAASTAPAFIGGVGDGTSSSRSTAARRDVLEVTGTGAPLAVRFRFRVHAVLTVDNTVDDGFFPDLSVSSLSVQTSSGILNFPSPSPPPLGIYAEVSKIGSGPVTPDVSSGWDSTQLTPIGPFSYNFTGRFSHTSDLLTGPGLDDGAYFVSAAVTAYSATRDSTSETDALTTMELETITLPDGQPLPDIPGLSLAFESGAPLGADDDADGVLNDVDNCTAVANPDQADSNGDLIGNACDADITGPGDIEDCLVNFLDLQLIKVAFLTNPQSPNWDARADLDASGLVNFLDLQIMQGSFFGPPGPSAAGCN